MSVTIATLCDKVHRELPANARRDLGDYESAIPEALKRVSYAGLTALFRPSLEVIITLTVSVRDALNRQTATLPTSSTVIIAGSIREGDVVHSDLTRPLLLRPINELTYLYSGSVLGAFAVDDGKVYVFKQGTAFATTSNALSVRGVKLMLTVADIPLEVEPFVVAEIVAILMGMPMVQETAQA
jgi:hypothetical protein